MEKPNTLVDIGVITAALFTASLSFHLRSRVTEIRET